MARFAADYLEKMNVLTRELEVTLGPDTYLKLRILSQPIIGRMAYLVDYKRDSQKHPLS
jgi:hypothetical protein